MGVLNHHQIVSLEIDGGFLEGTLVEFSDGLNCIIGGRGTGKTTILELIRFALGLMPDRTSARTPARKTEELVASNLDGGTVRLKFKTKHGIEYTATRRVGGDVVVYGEDGDVAPVTLDSDVIFTAEVYSQNEIEQIASTPQLQLELLDRFCGTELQEIAGALGREATELAKKRLELSRLSDELESAAASASEVATLEERLRGLEVDNGPDAALVQEAHSNHRLREREQLELRELRGALEEIRSEFAQVTTRLEHLTSGLFGDELREGPNGELIQSAREIREQAIKGARVALQAYDAVLVQAAEALDRVRKQIDERHKAQGAAYAELTGTLKEEGGRAAERQAVHRRLAEAKAAANRVTEIQERVKEVQAVRVDLLDRAEELRGRRFTSRRETARGISEQLGGAVRLEVVQGGDRSGYRNTLLRLMKQSKSKMHYREVIERVVARVPPHELAEWIVSSQADKLAAATSVDPDRAQRFLDALKPIEATAEVEAADLEDEPKLKLLHGEEYKDSTKVSTGQRCTTVLPILLLDSDRPLIIDQPEDNLDNAFIYQTVVKNVLRVKKDRQLIFVTHNPNIPVLGDAERVFVLESDGQRGTVAAAGSVNDLRAPIEQLLEGGREAFELRMRMYGH